MDITKNRSQRQIDNGDIIIKFIGNYAWANRIMRQCMKCVIASHITSHARQLIMGLGKAMYVIALI